MGNELRGARDQLDAKGRSYYRRWPVVPLHYTWLSHISRRLSTRCRRPREFYSPAKLDDGVGVRVEVLIPSRIVSLHVFHSHRSRTKPTPNSSKDRVMYSLVLQLKTRHLLVTFSIKPFSYLDF